MQLLLFDKMPEESGLNIIERMMRPRNLSEAYRRVKSNGGAPGIDGITVAQLGSQLRLVLPRLTEQLLNETYHPQPVRTVEIPKPGGGTRKLGIPTALDRLLQQALLQVLDPLFDPEFSKSSFGFRRGMGCHQAVRQAQLHIQEGFRAIAPAGICKHSRGVSTAQASCGVMPGKKIFV